MRRQAKTEKEYNIIEMAIKVCLNSLYGKTVQSVGGDEEKAPSCVCPYYGAAITAYCRPRVLEAACLDPYAVVCFMTDGIVSTRELKGLERVKEVFEGEMKAPSPSKAERPATAGTEGLNGGEPPEGVIIELGDWEMERMGGGFFLQSGVYHLADKSGKAKDKTRGADKGKFLIKMELRVLMEEIVLPKWKERFILDEPYTLDIKIRHFMTAGASIARENGSS